MNLSRTMTPEHSVLYKKSKQTKIKPEIKITWCTLKLCKTHGERWICQSFSEHQNYLSKFFPKFSLKLGLVNKKNTNHLSPFEVEQQVSAQSDQAFCKCWKKTLNYNQDAKNDYKLKLITNYTVLCI